MLLVKTYLARSLVHGFGCFSVQFIKAGTEVWKLHRPFDVVYTREQLLALPEPAREQANNYCYRDKSDGLYVLCGDDARFFNHADDAVLGYDEKHRNINLVDMYPGDEFTCDYYDFDGDAVRKLGPKNKRTRRK
jgi:hypothetical protein